MSKKAHLELQKQLKTIGFTEVDKYEDHEIGYVVYGLKSIEITFEADLWYLELLTGKETIKAIGVNTFESIKSFIQLIYGN